MTSELVISVTTTQKSCHEVWNSFFEVWNSFFRGGKWHMKNVYLVPEIPKNSLSWSASSILASFSSPILGRKIGLHLFNKILFSLNFNHFSTFIIPRIEEGGTQQIWDSHNDSNPNDRRHAATVGKRRNNISTICQVSQENIINGVFEQIIWLHKIRMSRFRNSVSIFLGN